MMRNTYLLGFVLLLLTMPNDGEGAQNAVARDPTSTSCPVTIANGIGILGNREPGSYGNGRLSVGQWPNGTVVFKPGGPGFLMRDGSLGMKFVWRRGVRGQLRIEGRRLDAPAAPLRANVSTGYGDFGFQSTSLIFS